MLNIYNHQKHSRGSFLSDNELHEGQNNTVREFRSIREIPNEQEGEQMKSLFSASAPVAEHLTDEAGHWQDDGGKS